MAHSRRRPNDQRRRTRWLLLTAWLTRHSVAHRGMPLSSPGCMPELGPSASSCQASCVTGREPTCHVSTSTCMRIINRLRTRKVVSCLTIMQLNERRSKRFLKRLAQPQLMEQGTPSRSRCRTREEEKFSRHQFRLRLEVLDARVRSSESFSVKLSIA